MENEMKDKYLNTVLITLGARIYELENSAEIFKLNAENTRTSLDYYRNEAKAWEEKCNAFEAEKNKWVERYRVLRRKYEPRQHETYEEIEPYDA